MERLAKNKALVILSAILLVANLVILSLWLFGKEQKQGRHPGGMMSGFLKNDVRFDEGQLETYYAAKKDHWSKMKPLFNELSGAKQELFKLTSVDNASPSQVDSLANIVGQKQANLDKAMLGHFKQVRKICKSEQVQVFDSLFPGIVSRMSGTKTKR